MLYSVTAFEHFITCILQKIYLCTFYSGPDTAITQTYAPCPWTKWSIFTWVPQGIIYVITCKTTIELENENGNLKVELTKHHILVIREH